ncbi:MAG: hypothetical protein ACK4HB_03385 [Candidatus Bipolaricaulia bacterium]
MRAKIALALAPLTLGFGLWAGLLRLGWALPTFKTLPIAHGPLMISGFLGALIGLERAVALRKGWGYLVPFLALFGTLLWAFGIVWGAWAAFAASIVLSALYLVAVRQQPSWSVTVMGAGALCWGVGNLLWALSWNFAQITPWWAAFLVLTIVGERLELARLQKLSGATRALLALSLALFLGGLLLALGHRDLGVRVFSVGMLALALWLLRYDIARRTVHQTGLVRYIAISLLSGYCWLGCAGIFGVIWSSASAGPYYDARWHALFVGFVFSMIFGHAPVIFPALLKLRIPFSASFYAPLALLHLSLIVRILSDLALWGIGRQWGGLLNALAILLFFANTGIIHRRSHQR